MMDGAGIFRYLKFIRHKLYRTEIIPRIDGYALYICWLVYFTVHTMFLQYICHDRNNGDLLHVSIRKNVMSVLVKSHHFFDDRVMCLYGKPIPTFTMSSVSGVAVCFSIPIHAPWARISSMLLSPQHPCRSKRHHARKESSAGHSHLRMQTSSHHKPRC